MLKEKDFNSIPLLSDRWRDDTTISTSPIEEFNNPLILESDLATGNYEAKIINSLDRFKEQTVGFVRTVL